MKKLLLSLSILLSVGISQAQVALEILQPASIAGGYGIGFTDNGWGFPDMNNPANAVTGFVEVARDATTADSLCCADNVADLTGKIALLYRGACQFGDKARYAQNAGAIGVIIVNNDPNGYIDPGAGNQGATVTIPVIMISAADGAALRSELDNSVQVEAFIGTTFLLYANNLRLTNGFALLPKMGSTLSANAQDASEYEVELEAVYVNVGQNDQFGVTATAEISFGGATIFSDTFGPFDIASEDSVTVTFNTFSQSSYATGDYTLTYSFTMSATDEFTQDDELVYPFRIDNDRLSLAELDANGQTTSSGGIRPAESTQPFTSCIVYQDPNASRRSVKSIGFSASTSTVDGIELTGELMEVVAYEWNDVITGLDAVTVSDITQVGFGEYFYDADDQGVTVYQDLENPFNMVDNQKYLFCVTTYSNDIFVGYENGRIYDYNESKYDFPNMLINVDGAWGLGFINPVYPAIVVETQSPIGIDENNTVEITPFPNPSSDIVNIPLAGMDGFADLKVMDLTGKIVKNQRINAANANNVEVNVSDLTSGIYVFNIIFENGMTSTFNVGVTR